MGVQESDRRSTWTKGIPKVHFLGVMQSPSGKDPWILNRGGVNTSKKSCNAWVSTQNQVPWLCNLIRGAGAGCASSF